MNWKTNWLTGTKVHAGWLFGLGIGYSLIWEIVSAVAYPDIDPFMYLVLIIVGYLIIIYWLKNRYEIRRRGSTK